MRLKYDFHIHSCLSPCGDDEMTPYNLVNMAKLCGLEVIALTDHNTAGNCRAAAEAGLKAGITLIPGMELCTAEEIHVVCLFPDIDAAEAFGEHIKKNMPAIVNKPDIFGRQLYMDSGDTVLGEEENLLVTASFVTIDEAPGLVKSFGGFCYPAHIDRPSFSITASLGDFPTELGFKCAEVSSNGDINELTAKYFTLKNVCIMRSSDAHDLESLYREADSIDPPSPEPKSVIDYLIGL